MKKIILLIALVAVAYLGFTQSGHRGDRGDVGNGEVAAVDNGLATAIARRQSKVPVQGEGIVTRVLSDDNAGIRHQRFIVRLGSGDTLLIAHNIDLAKRIEGLSTGDRVAFHGEYEWNPEGGVVHWTHRDPQGRHAAGWIEHKGQTYQ